eukprot:TRINITY_DN21411_c0_g1_i1.p1 TRINITY_DN21411_c0_g1~~TRINITY_DN21411_c0_g1_i1.p1  ORF type:complete len:621 (-),score=83.29 TRINITY_DN21411_c0_g1_i1:119-1981(-)
MSASESSVNLAAPLQRTLQESMSASESSANLAASLQRTLRESMSASESSVNIAASLQRMLQDSMSASESSVNLAAPLQPTLQDSIFLCVTSGALLGRERHLLVLPGSSLWLASDRALLLAAEAEYHSLTLALRCTAGGAEELMNPDVGSVVAASVAELLEAQREQVQLSSVSWADHTEPRSAGCIIAGVDVTLRVAATIGLDIAQIVEKLWLKVQMETVRVAASALRFLHLGKGASIGVESPGRPACATCCDCSACNCDDFDSGCNMSSLWTSSNQAVVRVAAQRHVGIAQIVGDATLQMCSKGASGLIRVTVARITEVRAENASGQPAASASCRDAPAVPHEQKITNADGVLVVPIRFFASAQGESQQQEILSGPFHTQNLNFSCAPTDSSVADFFDFRPWWAFRGPEHLFNSSSLGAAQAACLLLPKVPEVGKWRHKAAPERFGLQVSLGGQSMEQWKVAEWSFLPQFAVHSTGGAVRAGRAAARLSLARPSAVFEVWTSGQPVEATLIDRLESRAGAISLKTTGASGSGSSVLTITVSWDNPRPFERVRHLRLLMQSRATCQMDAFMIEVDGFEGGAPASYKGGASGAGIGRPLLLAVILGVATRLAAAAAAHAVER